jgi:tRNA1(Val) A37 N6-methylase TrmN6
MQAAIYRKLGGLVESFKTDRKPAKYVKGLFEALDWGSRPTFSIQQDSELDGFRLLIDRAPVIDVVINSPAGDVDKTYKALNRAYNQDVRWVVASDFNSLGLFGSYWVSFPHDISSALAFRLDSPDYLLESHRLELLTPQGIAHNRLDQLYDAVEGKKRRIPIDLHLMERMSGWRHLALQALGVQAASADSLIHRLINTLILIRYLEDIKKLDAPSLMELLNESDKSTFITGLHSIFAYVKELTSYRVPIGTEIRVVENVPLRRLISQLYGYPDLGIKYDFSAMTVDVLGRFYEEYLRSSVLPFEADQEQLISPTLFSQPSFALENVRRTRGIYYTPRYIVDYILRNLIESFKTANKNSLPVLLDIATGSGTFLTAAFDNMSNSFPKAGPADIVDHLIGLDVDERAIEAARLNLTLKLIGHGVESRSYNLHLEQHDILLHAANTDLSTFTSSGVDIVVGNPPYIQYEKLSKHLGSNMEAVRANYETASGRFDSYILFIEAAVKCLRQGGFGGLVVPNRLLYSQSASTLRDWLTQRVTLLEVIDFLD